MFDAREIHVYYNMQGYGRELVGDVSLAALLLNCDYSDAQKEQLAINICQLGIDMYSIVTAGGGSFGANGGLSSGWKTFIVLAGKMLGNAAMRDIGVTKSFGEDIFLISRTTEIIGTICPPLPPPANNIFINLIVVSSVS